jgi:hypothetical protein
MMRITLAYIVKKPERLSITNTLIALAANIAASGGLMTNWKVTSYYYLEAESEGEAWTMASLELPDNSQITTLEGEGE